jgi:hypothetical protein
MPSFSGVLDLALGRRLFEGRPEPATFRQAATVAEGLGLASEGGRSTWRWWT